MAEPTERRVRNEEEAEKLISEWEGSGERISDWCSNRGINWHSMNGYKSLRTRQSRSAFVELTVEDTGVPIPAASVPSTECRYRIFLGDDVGIEVDGHFRDETLLRLIRLVSSC